MDAYRIQIQFHQDIIKRRYLCVLMIAVILICYPLSTACEEINNEIIAAEQNEEHEEEATEPSKGGKWVPIPIFLTEPAIGYGLGLSVGYIHPEKSGEKGDNVSSLQTPRSIAASQKSQKKPPSITGVAGGYTESGTWFGAIGHSASWREDAIRYGGAAAYTDIISIYYVSDRPFDFDLEGLIIFQDLKFRLGRSHFFLGGKLIGIDTETSFDIEITDDINIAIDEIYARNIGAALALSFDRRDNVFTPNTGQMIELTAWRHDEAIGSDYDYWKASFKALSFHQLHPKFVLGLRFEASSVDGEPPFYAYPYIDLRGIPALRYQGERVGTVEVEARWNIMPRWSLVGFLGKGEVSGDDPSFQTQDDIYAGGIGGRYLFLKEQSLWLGLDFARGPEEWYWYITVGQAW